MQKRIGLYAIVWTVLLALFNVIAFVSVFGFKGGVFTENFWIGYIFITVVFFGQLACSCIALNAENFSKLFLNIPLLRASYIGLIFSFIVGGVFMFLDIPYVITVIVCAVILALNVFAVVRALAVSGAVSRVDTKIKVQTFFIKSLTVDADTLVASAKSDEAKAECKKVYDAIRYSDPMSSDALAAIEGQISIKFAALSAAVGTDDIAKVSELANEVIILIGNRNGKCKLLK